MGIFVFRYSRLLLVVIFLLLGTPCASERTLQHRDPKPRLLRCDFCLGLLNGVLDACSDRLVVGNDGLWLSFRLDICRWTLLQVSTAS